MSGISRLSLLQQQIRYISRCYNNNLTVLDRNRIIYTIPYTCKIYIPDIIDREIRETIKGLPKSAYSDMAGNFSQSVNFKLTRKYGMDFEVRLNKKPLKH